LFCGSALLSIRHRCHVHQLPRQSLTPAIYCLVCYHTSYPLNSLSIYDGGVFRGRWCEPPLVCTVFVSFFSRLNRKIRFARLLMTVRVFCSYETAPRLIIIGTKNDFSEVVAQPPPARPTPLSAYGTTPTEVLNRALIYGFCLVVSGRSQLPR